MKREESKESHYMYHLSRKAHQLTVKHVRTRVRLHLYNQSTRTTSRMLCSLTALLNIGLRLRLETWNIGFRMERAISFLRQSSNVSTLYREPAMMQRGIWHSDGASLFLRIRARTARHWQL